MRVMVGLLTNSSICSCLLHEWSVPVYLMRHAMGSTVIACWFDCARLFVCFTAVRSRLSACEQVLRAGNTAINTELVVSAMEEAEELTQMAEHVFKQYAIMLF